MSRPVAYLVSRYPYVTHTFVQREVEALRRQGVEVHTFAVRRAAPDEVLSEADRVSFATTSALLPVRLGVAVGALVDAVRHPGAVVAAARYALSRADAGWRASVWQLFYVCEALLLRRLLLRRGVRHVHAHFANVAADVARLVARYGNAVDGAGTWTWSFTMHGPTEFAAVERFDLGGKAGEADLVACISDFCRSQLMALTPADRWSRFHVVHCGVETARFSPIARGDGGRIVCVGQLADRKGQALLVDAVASLVERGVDASLTIVGDGPARSSLEAQVDRLGLRARVTFTGAVGQDDILRHYAEADVFCLPSFAEGVPVVLMEAMATGLPVVTTLIAGVPELVADGESGFLVPPGRVDALADALAKLLADPDLRARMGEAGRRRVLESFDVDRAAADLRRLFAALTG